VLTYLGGLQICDDLQSAKPTLKLLYITPEKLLSKKQKSEADKRKSLPPPKLKSILDRLYQQKLISLFVVDEVRVVDLVPLSSADQPYLLT